MVRLVYDLRSDQERVSLTQKATLTTTDFGIEQTHGLFGSDVWWQEIEVGNLPIHTISGTITRVYMGSMNDWPEFEITEEDGTTSNWTRESNSKEQADLYLCGRKAEIDYVVQHLRRKSWDQGG